MSSLWPDILDAKEGVTRQRVAWLTCSGTWAAPGTGYPSWVVQNADEGLVFEVPVQAPWSFGPVNAPDPNSPSYNESVAIGKDWAISWLLAWPGLWGIGGYSQGGQCASEIFLETRGGRLAGLADSYVGGFTLGNPMRQAGHTGGGAPDPGGAGISPVQMTGMDERWWDEANGPANGAAGIDLYTATPLNRAGAIIRIFYGMGVDIGLSHPEVMLMAWVKGIVELLMALMGSSGSAPSGVGILGGLSGPLAILGPLAAVATPLLSNKAVPSLFSGAGGLSGITSLIPGLAIVDAIEAAILGLQFMFEGTSPHITYDTTDAVPGVNHIAHAVGHVNAVSTAGLANLAHAS